MKPVIFLLAMLMSLHAGQIRVAVAANVSYAIDDLIAAFHRHYPGIRVEVQPGSSGKLTAQIMHGAPYDLFMSANMRYPLALYRKGIAVTRPMVYAQGALALFSAKARDLSGGFDLLTDPAIGRIAIANPQTAPYGKATVEALQKRGIFDRLKPKLIYGESISQTMVYAMKAADIGIVAASSRYAPKLSRYDDDRHWQRLDVADYTPIDQGIVLLKHADSNPDAAAFYAFIFSHDAEAIFRKYGYRIP